MKPAHRHHCESCVLLGQLTAPIIGDATRSITWDFYLCTVPGERELFNARSGSGEGAYVSSKIPAAQLANDITKWPLNVAAQLALTRRTISP